MSSPAPTSSPVVPVEPGFDPLVFWVQHGRKVLIFLGLFVLALLIYFASEVARTRKLEAAARALAEAKDEDGWRKVISNYDGTVVAGDAQILLAEKFRKDGKLDEAATTLRNCIEHYPEHPLISGAWTSLAATQEAQGKQDDALGTYQKVSTTFSNSFSAPLALLGQARIFAAKGKAEEAKRLNDQVINQFPETSFAQQAQRENHQHR